MEFILIIISLRRASASILYIIFLLLINSTVGEGVLLCWDKTYSKVHQGSEQGKLLRYMLFCGMPLSKISHFLEKVKFALNQNLL